MNNNPKLRRHFEGHPINERHFWDQINVFFGEWLGGGGDFTFTRKRDLTLSLSIVPIVFLRLSQHHYRYYKLFQYLSI
jgi:hypothetical protein